MSGEHLNAYPKKKLADLARREGLSGWKIMNKEQLIHALNRARNKPKKASNGVARPAARPPVKAKSQSSTRETPAGRGSNGHAEQNVERSKFDVGAGKDLSARAAPTLANGYGKDRIVVMVRDPFWLHAYWELTHQAVQRAEAALGQDWHGARPILRLLDVSSYETTSTAEAIVRDIEIHGGCSNWYIEVKEPPKSYRVDIGYVSRRGQFFCAARSNVVTTPRANASDTIDENWADLDTNSAERLVAMSTGYDPAHAPSSLELKELFEERLRRPMSAPPLSSIGFAAPPTEKGRKFWFKLDAELIVYGATDPNAKVTLQGEPVKLRSDGTFTMRFSLPDGRQIIPAVAASVDGIDERTIVLAVERNTKQLEPTVHDPGQG